MKWMSGQGLCECVEVCNLGKSKRALLQGAWGVKAPELLTWEGCGKVTSCTFLKYEIRLQCGEICEIPEQKESLV